MPKQKKPDPSDTKFNRFKRIAKWTFNNTPLAEILFISTFVLIRWWNNSDFSYLSEIFIPVVAFSVLVTAIFYIYRFIFGPGLAAHAAALSLSYLLYVFQFIEGAQLGKFVYGLIPDSVSSPFNRSLALAFVLGLLCWLIVWLLAKFLSRFPVLKQLQPYKILLFVIVFVFFVQVFRCADRMFEMRHQLAYNYPSPALEVADSQDDVKKPDIYYLVFDRYANPEMLKENFDFDNSEIVDSLAGQGFVTRQNAYSNYAFTMSSISSTLAMDYFPDLERRFGSESKWQSAAPYRSILRNPPVAQLLKSQGYQYNQVSSWWDFTRIGIDADKQPTLSYRLRVLNKSFYLSDLQRDIFFKSILSPWFKKGLSFGNWAFLKYDIDRNPVENFNAQMASLKGISSRGDKSNPQFTFAHILAPHPPYVFDENGNLPTYDVESNDNGVDEAVKYTNELKYINKRLMELVAFVRQSSPEAIIILQPDEGPYPKQFRGPMSQESYYDPAKLPQQEMKQKFSIFASYYLPGVEKSQAEQINSSVNIFRFVLAEYLGYDLKLLPDCHLSSGNKFNIYNYTLVNDKLSGLPQPEDCKQYE